MLVQAGIQVAGLGTRPFACMVLFTPQANQTGPDVAGRGEPNQDLVSCCIQ